MAAAVVRLDGHVVLMVKRRGSGDGTYWHLPAGAIHSDETQLEAVRRVLREQTGLNGRVLGWPRGRVLGGSSAINGLLHVRGQPEDYDGWAAAGCDG